MTAIQMMTNLGLAFARDDVPLTEQLSAHDCAVWLMKVIGEKDHMSCFIRDSFRLSADVNRSLQRSLAVNPIKATQSEHFRVRSVHRFYYMQPDNLGRLEPSSPRATMYVGRTTPRVHFWVADFVGNGEDTSGVVELDIDGLANLIGDRNPEAVALEIIRSFMSAIESDRAHLVTQVKGLESTDHGLAYDYARFAELGKKRRQAAQR